MYDVGEGPRVYIERINIIGNARTLDYVIRREFDMSEGDAFNQQMITKAKRRLEAILHPMIGEETSRQAAAAGGVDRRNRIGHRTNGEAIARQRGEDVLQLPIHALDHIGGEAEQLIRRASVELRIGAKKDQEILVFALEA